jgi:hypothetical protein
MKKIKIEKVINTASGERVKNLRIVTVNDGIKKMTAPIQIISGAFQYYDRDLNQLNWLECTWDLNGRERAKLSEYENHDLYEMQPQKELQKQLNIF